MEGCMFKFTYVVSTSGEPSLAWVGNDVEVVIFASSIKKAEELVLKPFKGLGATPYLQKVEQVL